jgi:transposase
MKPADARTLSSDAQQDLRERVVHAIDGGMSQAAAARAFGVHRSAVNRWAQAARIGGTAALASRRRGRRPTGGPLAPSQEAELLDVLRTRMPDDVGLPMALWTREAVGLYAERAFGVRRSRWVWGHWLNRRGFTPQRPARRAYEQDPAALTRWRTEEYPAIAARAKAAGAEIHWADESGLRSDHPAGRSYSPRGQTPVVRQSGRPFRVNLLSTLTNLGVLRFAVFGGRFTAAVFIEFLRRLMRSVAEPVFLIVDGHPVHRSKKVREWVAAQKGRIVLFFLPPYCPELNPTELLNNDVKGNVPRLRRPKDKPELTAEVRGYLRQTQRRPAIVRSYFEAQHVRYAA